MLLDQLQQKFSGGKIAFLGHPLQYPAVFLFVFIVMATAYIKE
jgi:hypothetical protein